MQWNSMKINELTAILYHSISSGMNLNEICIILCQTYWILMIFISFCIKINHTYRFKNDFQRTKTQTSEFTYIFFFNFRDFFFRSGIDPWGPWGCFSSRFTPVPVHTGSFCIEVKLGSCSCWFWWFRFHFVPVLVPGSWSHISCHIGSTLKLRANQKSACMTI